MSGRCAALATADGTVLIAVDCWRCKTPGSAWEALFEPYLNGCYACGASSSDAYAAERVG